MLPVNIHHIHQFTAAKKNSYIQPTHVVTLSVSGLKYSTIDGFAAEHLNNALHFVPAKSHVTYESTIGRECWVISFSSDKIRRSDDRNLFEILFKETWLPMPMSVPIPTEYMNFWRAEFMKMRDITLNPCDIDQFQLHLGMMNIWRYFLSGAPEHYATSPATRLKTYIDEDRACAHSISYFSDQIKMNVDHLRSLFKKQYNMTPVSYRQQRRMSMALDLIANTDLSIQEIAKECGFEQLSNFSASFKQAYKGSPREMQKKYRAG
ncbi:MAG: helix-turn-helix transcriptional regulator [Planctomycetes bacterium]|nr:helix-turn-helix transcriptional regulator [Planctomycetota bacterium]